MQKKANANPYNYSNISMDREFNHHNQTSLRDILEYKTSLEEAPLILAEPDQVIHHHRYTTNQSEKG